MRNSMARLMSLAAATWLLVGCQATGPVTSSPSPVLATQPREASSTVSSRPPAASASPAAEAIAWRLVALGDSDTTGSGLFIYPSEKGQRLMADLLYATGLAPLVDRQDASPSFPH